MESLTNEVQIEIIEEAIKSLTSDQCYRGCCFHLMKAIQIKLSVVDVFYHEIRELYIPSFTRGNAFTLSKRYRFAPPVLSESYWWDSGTVGNKRRVKFLNALITELKK